LKYSIRPSESATKIMKDRRISAVVYAQRIVLLLLAASIVLSIYLFRNDIVESYVSFKANQQLDNVVSANPEQLHSTIYFEPDNENIYRLFDGNLAVLNAGTFRLYSPDGSELLTLQLNYQRPGICVSDRFVAAFSYGSSEIAVTERKTLVSRIQTDGTITSVSQNANGWLATVCSTSDYRSVVSVYNANQNVVYTWKSADYYVLQAQVSPDCKTMAAVALTQENGTFITRMITFRLDKEEYHAVLDIENTLIESLYYLDDDTLCGVGDDQTIICSTDGKIISAYPYKNDKLHAAACADGYVVLSLSDRTSGLGAKIVRISADGSTKLRTTSEEVRQLSACGGYVAVLFTQSLGLYNSDLDVLAESDDVTDVRSILVNQDGFVLLIYPSEAAYTQLLTSQTE